MDRNKLLKQYKQLLADTDERGFKLSDVNAMEELDIDKNTLEELKSMLSKEELSPEMKALFAQYNQFLDKNSKASVFDIMEELDIDIDTLNKLKELRKDYVDVRLLAQYKRVVEIAKEDGVTLSDIDIMEELGLDFDTLKKFKEFTPEQLDELLKDFKPVKNKNRDHEQGDESELDIGERSYGEDEEEVVEETILDEEKSDEYYEDMFEEDWEEIEAAVEKEEEKERAAKIKAEREKKATKKREEESRKKREEALRLKTEEGNKPAQSQTSADSTVATQDDNQIPPVAPIADTSADTTVDVPPSTSPTNDGFTGGFDQIDTSFGNTSFGDGFSTPTNPVVPDDKNTTPPADDVLTEYEKKRAAEETKRAEEARKAEEVRRAEEARRAAEAEKLAEQARQAEEFRKMAGYQSVQGAPSQPNETQPVAPVINTAENVTHVSPAPAVSIPNMSPVSPVPDATAPIHDAEAPGFVPIQVPVETQPVPAGQGDDYKQPDEPKYEVPKQQDVKHAPQTPVVDDVPSSTYVPPVVPVAPNVEPVSMQNDVPPVVPVSAPSTPTGVYDHNQVASEIENADYSRNHQFENQAAQKASIEIKTEEVAAQTHREEQPQTPVTPHGSVVGTARDEYKAPIQADPISHTPSDAVHAQRAEESFYTPAGVPLSVEARIPHIEPVHETFAPNNVFSSDKVEIRAAEESAAFRSVYARYDEDISVLSQQVEHYTAQLADMKERGVSQDVIAAVQADLDYHKDRLESTQAGRLKTEEAINSGALSAESIIYHNTARTMLNDYEQETFGLTRQMVEAKGQLRALEDEIKQHPETANSFIVEKASLQADINHYQERLETIRTERQEILDTMYTNSPAKSIISEAAVRASVSIYDKDIFEVTAQIQASKAQLAKMREEGASAAEISNAKADIDFYSSRLRDIKAESNRVADAVHNGVLTVESVAYIPAAKAMIDEYDKQTWDITKQLTEAKNQLTQMKAEGVSIADRMNIEKEIDIHVANLQNIQAERRVITDALYEGKAPLKDVVYINSAKKQLAVYEKDTWEVTKQLVTARQELQRLKDDPKASEKDIAKAEKVVTRHQNKLAEIQADRKRVADFINNGPRRISQKDIEGSEYSRDHRNELGKQAREAVPANGKYVTNSNMKGVHQTRMRNLMDKFGGMITVGAKNVVMRETEEDEDLARAERTSGYIKDVVGISNAFDASNKVSKELKRLGLDKLSVQKDLENIGVITGIGDVTKMSVKELKEALVKGGSKLSLSEIQEVLKQGVGIEMPYERRQQIIQAIGLKEKLKMHDTMIADLATRHAGEYVNWSKKKLLKLLKDDTLSVDVRMKAEIALQYKKLTELNTKALRRWKLTGNLASGLARKMISQNDYLGDVLTLSEHARTGYRATRAVYNLGKRVVTGNVKQPEETSRAVKKIIKQQKPPAAESIKNTIKQPVKKNALIKDVGKKAENLIGKGKQLAHTTAKGAAGFAQKLSNFGSKVAGTIKNAAAVIGKVLAPILGAAGGAVGGILLIVLLFAMVVVLLFAVVMGDSTVKGSIFDRSTSVEEMADYLDEKNEEWLAEIQELIENGPTTPDKHGDVPEEFTKVHYTFYDSMGDICLVTDNTKEIISMAAVYFRQDFSDADKVYEYIDELWEKSHILTTSETPVYDCVRLDEDGEYVENICFNNMHQFQPDVQGFNGHERQFYCNEDPSDIKYDDCYMNEKWHDYRVDNVDKFASYRLGGIFTSPNYHGISDLRIFDESIRGYGCSESVGTFYCTGINSIRDNGPTSYTRSEIIARLVQETGIPYITLSDDEGCEQKHKTDSEGQPADNCNKYHSYYKAFSVGFYDALPSGYYYDFVWDDAEGYYVWDYIDNAGVQHTMYIPGQGDGYKGQHIDTDNVVLSYSGYEDGVYWYNYAIRYYSCDEKTCPGHSITYHTCSGHDLAVEHNHECYLREDCPAHLEKVCHGHIDLKINIEVRGFDHNWLFMTPVEADDGFIWDDQGDIDWATTIRDQNWEELYGLTIPSSLFPDDEVMGSVIMPTHANALPIPLYNQMEYNTPYGAYGTVASHGCGITCIAMVAAYHQDKDVSPAMLGRMFGKYNTAVGSSWTVFEETAPDLQIPFEKQTYSWAEVVQALQDGKPVVSSQSSRGLFTTSGHFILFTGITEDGRILVNDPNGYNYSKSSLRYGFANGFTQEQILQGAVDEEGRQLPFWIYGAKEAASPTN